MTINLPAEAIEAGAKAAEKAGWTCSAHEPAGLDQCTGCAKMLPRLAKIILTAAHPAIEQHLKHQIAEEVRELEPDRDQINLGVRSGRGVEYYDGYPDALLEAARIARGQTKQSEEGHQQ